MENVDCRIRDYENRDDAIRVRTRFTILDSRFSIRDSRFPNFYRNFLNLSFDASWQNLCESVFLVCSDNKRGRGLCSPAFRAHAPGMHSPRTPVGYGGEAF